ncbi:MAG TPA: DsbC family protein [Methylophilaceae bacterium]|nr:DsbC family protein [Methylophilaceae bacterium]
MLKKFCVALAALMISGAVIANDASLRKAIESAYPKVSVGKITKTPYGGLYEVVVNGQIVYTDEKFSFLIVDGGLIDTKTKKDITRERMDELSRIDFSRLPLEQAVKVVKGSGARKIAVFSDPDCPYCKRLEQQELTKINDVTIYTFLYPLEQLHPDATRKSKAIWCATDRSKAWMDWVMKEQLPKSGSDCETPLQKVADLGRSLGVNSTPTIFLSNGRRIQGAYPADELEKAMNEAGKSQ